MLIISHRGNLTGSNPSKENSIDYIEEAIFEGFDVEVDLWFEDNYFYLGHDQPQNFVPVEWLERFKNNLWIHCKNKEALEKISSLEEFNYFWHESDKYTITSKGIGWCLVGEIPYSKSILVLPEKSNFKLEYIKKSYGICTDDALFYRCMLNNTAK
jgi:hypothetical protein